MCLYRYVCEYTQTKQEIYKIVYMKKVLKHYLGTEYMTWNEKAHNWVKLLIHPKLIQKLKISI